MPFETLAGMGYRYSKRMIFGFDLQYARFRGDEVLIGSGLTPAYDDYKVARSAYLSPHFGAEYKTSLFKRVLFLRGGYYYQPNIFEGLSSRYHLTYSLSWSLIKMPRFMFLGDLDIGFSNDIADKYSVSSITLDGNF
ncbi:MAG: hypothetical protein LHV68_07475 [Elusimicrobia bacterium]|nr:hypothetical protein [Candidatus Liberimonas magnetica]